MITADLVLWATSSWHHQLVIHHFLFLSFISVDQLIINERINFYSRVFEVLVCEHTHTHRTAPCVCVCVEKNRTGRENSLWCNILFINMSWPLIGCFCVLLSGYCSACLCFVILCVNICKIITLWDYIGPLTSDWNVIFGSVLIRTSGLWSEWSVSSFASLFQGPETGSGAEWCWTWHTTGSEVGGAQFPRQPSVSENNLCFPLRKAGFLILEPSVNVPPGAHR